MVVVVDPNPPAAPPNGVLVWGCCPNPVEAGAPNPPTAGAEPNEDVAGALDCPKPPKDDVAGLAPNAEPPNGVLPLGCPNPPPCEAPNPPPAGAAGAPNVD